MTLLLRPTPKSVPGPLLALESLSNAVVNNWSQYDHVAAVEFKCRNILILCIEDSVLAQKKKMAYTFFIKLNQPKKKIIPNARSAGVLRGSTEFQQEQSNPRSCSDLHASAPGSDLGIWTPAV